MQHRFDVAVELPHVCLRLGVPPAVARAGPMQLRVRLRLRVRLGMRMRLWAGHGDLPVVRCEAGGVVLPCAGPLGVLGAARPSGGGLLDLRWRGREERGVGARPTVCIPGGAHRGVGGDVGVGVDVGGGVGDGAIPAGKHLDGVHDPRLHVPRPRRIVGAVPHRPAVLEEP